MFREWLQQLKEMKHYFIAAAAVFAVGIFLGYTETDRFLYFLQNQTDHLKTIVDGVSRMGSSRFWLIAVIFTNNMLVSLLMMYAGGFFCLLPLFSLISNGLLTGYLAQVYVPSHGWWSFLISILPHGIIEIPAILFASAYGIKFGTYVAKMILYLPFPGQRNENNKQMLRFLKITFPASVMLAVLLLIAAVVEGTVTYAIVK